MCMSACAFETFVEERPGHKSARYLMCVSRL